jgi:hypothetical protein
MECNTRADMEACRFTLTTLQKTNPNTTTFREREKPLLFFFLFFLFKVSKQMNGFTKSFRRFSNLFLFIPQFVVLSLY